MKILVVALHYHNYTDRIVDEMRAAGHHVSVHDIQPRNLMMKALRVGAPRIWQRLLDRHHLKILAAERRNIYDHVVFIQVTQMAYSIVSAFRKTFSPEKMILYNWDSVKTIDYTQYADLFDDVMTFDPVDAATHGFQYLPLFCMREFQSLARREQERRGVYFVGNVVTSQRYDAFDAFRRYCADHALRLQSYLACTPVVQARLKRSGRNLAGLKHGSIDRATFIDMIESSIAVFDFANHSQAGYTMRVIENLCMGKKIITSNARIVDEPFYSPDRIHVFADMNFAGIDDFLKIPLADPDESFADFHIQNFVRRLIEGRGHPIVPSA